MKLRDLVVVIDGSARSGAVVSLAVQLARRHNAHLTGFCPLQLLYPANLGFALSGQAEMLAVSEAAHHLYTEARERARSVEAGFREQLRRDDVRGDWQIASGPVAAAVAHRARSADLLVFGQADPDHPLPPTGRGLIEDALMSAGRPLLLVPFAGRFGAIGANVLIGWNGTREAARATHDALLVIEPGARVTVLTVERSKSASGPEEVPGADIAEHLAHHGLKITAARTINDGSITDADALLGYASDTNADLLVVGGYGHSRAREMVLGGVSRELLDHATLPVLISH
jgi:nucleotide-binding universal stress UspA family protein